MLDRVVAVERYVEMLEVLTPAQLVVVALQLDGMDGQEIGEALGITQAAVNDRLKYARRKVAGRFPELDMEGRSRLRCKHKRRRGRR